MKNLLNMFSKDAEYISKYAKYVSKRAEYVKYVSNRASLIAIIAQFRAINWRTRKQS